MSFKNILSESVHRLHWRISFFSMVIYFLKDEMISNILTPCSELLKFSLKHPEMCRSDVFSINWTITFIWILPKELTFHKFFIFSISASSKNENCAFRRNWWHRKTTFKTMSWPQPFCYRHNFSRTRKKQKKSTF